MPFRTFVLQICCLAAITALLNIFVPLFAAFPRLAWASWLLFLNISVVGFILAKYAVKMPQKNAFVGVFMGITAFKLIAAPTLVYWYKLHHTPSSMAFITPFLLFFLIFMLYETYFLALVAKEV